MEPPNFTNMNILILVFFALFLGAAGITNYMQPRDSKVPITLLIVAVAILSALVIVPMRL